MSIRVRLKNASDVTGEGTVVGGKGLSTDIVHASALAYLDAVNRVAFQIGRLDYRTTTV